MSDEKEAEEPKKKGKLPLILGVVVVLALAGGGGWYYMQSQKKAEENAEGEEKKEKAHIEEPIKVDMTKRTFVNLESFTFNLRDEEQDRFGQAKIVLELANPGIEAQLEAVAPAIRNAILMILTSKTSKEVLSSQGKKDLASEMINATNAILSGKEPPTVMTAEQRKKKSEAMRKLVLQMAKEDPDFRLESHETKSHYPERIIAAHFSQFIVQ
ncbi:MAG: flagellar basal body-associated FliL family protein [Burkholderiaceae bacterium]